MNGIHRVIKINIIAVAILGAMLFVNNTSATNPTTLDYSVTIKPSLSLTVSSNNVVLNLNPAINQFGTQDLNISVGTNNSYGYKLYVSSKDNSTDLVKDSSSDSINDTIPTLENNTSDTTSDSFPINKWGYKLVSNTTNDTVYKPFTSGLLVSESSAPTNADNSTITFAAKVDYNKPAGTYALDLNFKAVPTVTTYYMQDIAASTSLAESVCTEDPTIVIDKRDERPYTIRRINGTCWMVDNLQFTGTTMDSTTTNISSEYTPENPYVVNGGDGYYDLVDEGASGGQCYGDANNNGAGYSNACIHSGIVAAEDTSLEIAQNTIWYNYTAASAGTITASTSVNPQIYDICPSGWHLPTSSDAQTIGDGTSTYTGLFNPIYGGRYNGGGQHDKSTFGGWWTTGAYTAPNRYFIPYTNGALNYGYGLRLNGLYVRCVLGDTNIHNLTYMQDFSKLTDTKKTQVINSMELNSTTGYKLKDLRDNNEYTINKIGPEGDTFSQNIWMTSNLLFQGTTLTPDTSNVTQTRYMNSTTSPGTYVGYSLKDNASSVDANCYGSSDYEAGVANGGAGFSNACTYYTSDNNGDPNVWYNFAAASAGTVKGFTNSGISSEDICPKGWKLPNRSQFTTIDEAYTTAFNPVLMGTWDGGTHMYTNYGVWGTSEAYNNIINWYEYFNGSDGEFSIHNGWMGRHVGMSIRCTAK